MARHHGVKPRKTVAKTKELCEGDGCSKDRSESADRGRTLPGLRLCAECRDRFATGLTELPRLHEACGRVLGGGASEGLREIRAGNAAQGLPFNGAAADIRAEIVSVLSSWSALVAEGRDLGAPRRAVGAMADFLLRHLDWLGAHPAAAEASHEVARLRRTARKVAYPGQVRRLSIGTCTESGCDGELVAWIRTPGETRPSEIRCEAEPRHTWPGHQWTQLRRSMRRSTASPSGSTERWLAAAAVARLWNTPIGTVYRLASQQGWRRRNRAGRTYYAETDVQDCFNSRAGTA